MPPKRTRKRILWFVVLLFILMNVVAFFHAYKFTHFTDRKVSKTNTKKLSLLKKIQTLVFGVDNPRPSNSTTPTHAYEVVKLQSNKVIEGWHIKMAESKGTVILFHGYGGEKSSMLDKSDEFLKLGYNTFLVDFMGSGGSEGNQTTLGFKEADEVNSCYQYVSGLGDPNIYLFGTSLGAVAIMKAINDYRIKPRGIIIECPFGTMYETTCARFNALKVPEFPMAGLLVFWGGVQNNFWAFDHEPVEYAKNITCPTLLLYGEQDDKVSRKEINEIYTNLKGPKSLKTYPLAGHENYLMKYKQKWVHDNQAFLNFTNSLVRN